MKKWGFLIFILILISIAVITNHDIFQEIVDIQEIQQKDNYKKTSESQKRIEITEDQIYKGDLILVNSEYPVQRDSIKSDIVNLFTHRKLTKGYGLLDNEIKLSEEIALEFSKMITAAKKDGVVHFIINSGFREFEEQGSLYLEMGEDYALPAGYSEHNLGLSLDVGSTEDHMYEAAEGEWIEKNAWKYGFILRYPKDKTEVTGIQYEPWHIRYVGLPHSAIMKEKNFALEEYLNYLKKEKNISVGYKDSDYTINYYPVTQSRTIDVSKDNNYEISGNNMDGVIVTNLDDN
ncbi:VanY-A/VanY-F/VanY-M family D-Ala-D-Ala carboxypeptidase [Mangrovibacillus sp. Mu-81]|uniref:VanY-A/VanY-F/VanY-M family D-Ala-D-Ala carboxypeptidase n=1 Tax=Mangrovibacillus sp. Mu-81 TaxID=3121478 RepID=UPI002FE45AB8